MYGFMISFKALEKVHLYCCSGEDILSSEVAIGCQVKYMLLQTRTIIHSGADDGTYMTICISLRPVLVDVEIYYHRALFAARNAY
jgi:hypothetical protein